MSSRESLAALVEFQRTTEALAAVAQRLDWDRETMMPRGAAQQRSEEIAAMEEMLHARRTDPRVGEWLDDARAESEAEVRIVELIDRDFRRKSAVPARLATELARLTSLSQGSGPRRAPPTRRGISCRRSTRC